MAWFIEAGRPSVSTVSEYSDGPNRRPLSPPPTFRRSPFDEAARKKLSRGVVIAARNDGHIEHLVLDQNGYLLLSKPALEVLERFQKTGWEVFPMEATTIPKGLEGTLSGDTYYLLNLYLHRDLVDIEKSNLQPQLLFKGMTVEMTVYWLDRDHRQIAIKRDLIGDMMIWLGDGEVCGKTFFIADPLKEAWCDMGMNPAAFERCIDV